MNLSTSYLGMKLGSPLIVGASPFSDSVHLARQLQDAGAGAIVMRSLFEEQIDFELRALTHHTESPAESFAEATTYFPKFAEYQLSPDRYLRQIADLKGGLTVPIIASLNGWRPGGWTDYARRFESAGADALELNLYQLVTSPSISGDEVEADMLEIVHRVTHSVRIPVAVKLSPFHTAPVQFIAELEHAGAAGAVLFNRFYQPDFDLEELEVQPLLRLSDPSELLIRLRWLAASSPNVKGSLAASGGAHSAEDVIKALLAGAHCVQLVSVLLRNGPRYLFTLLEGIKKWMEQHGYESIDELRGVLNLRHCPDPSAFERANYIKILQTWRV